MVKGHAKDSFLALLDIILAGTSYNLPVAGEYLALLALLHILVPLNNLTQSHLAWATRQTRITLRRSEI